MAIVVHMHANIDHHRPYGAKEARIFLEQILPEAPDVTVQIAHLAGGGGYDDPTIARALPCRSIAVPKRAPGLPNRTQPRLHSAGRNPLYLFASYTLCSVITFGKPASHFQRTYRCRAAVQRQLLRIRLSEAHPTARGPLRKHQVLVGITRNSGTPAPYTYSSRSAVIHGTGSERLERTFPQPWRPTAVDIYLIE